MACVLPMTCSSTSGGRNEQHEGTALYKVVEYSDKMWIELSSSEVAVASHACLLRSLWVINAKDQQQ